MAQALAVGALQCAIDVIYIYIVFLEIVFKGGLCHLAGASPCSFSRSLKNYSDYSGNCLGQRRAKVAISFLFLASWYAISHYTDMGNLWMPLGSQLTACGFLR